MAASTGVESVAVLPDAPSPVVARAADLTQPRISFVRQNGKQQNLVSIAPEAQAHIVVENYVAIPEKRVVALNQHGGNIGAGFWWSSDTAQALTASDPRVVRDGGLVGTSILVGADEAGVVVLDAPVLDSVRALRDRATLGVDDRTALREKMGAAIPPAAVRARIVEASAQRIVFERAAVESNAATRHMHRAILEAVPGTTLSVQADGRIAVASSGRPKVRIAYLTDYPQLTPYAPLDLLAGPARRIVEADLARAERGDLPPSERAELQRVVRCLEDLASLVFHEKALAGGWRFLTYFGRDTLQVVQMLAPLLAPEVIEGVVQAAIDRLSPDGQVAHEESIADQAAHERLQHGARSLDGIEAPIFDYKMIDDDFMIVSLLADMSPAFIARNREPIARALAHVASRATPYARSGDPRDLVKLHDGEVVGDWRDSAPGLAHGRYPSSVNLTLVPTTLSKADKLGRALGLDTDFAALAEAWRDAAKHFEVRFTQNELRDRLRWFLRDACTLERRAYFGAVEIEPGVSVDDFVYGAPLKRDGLRFPAIALDDDARPIPVMTSDGVMGFLGSSAQPAMVATMAEILTLPYPLGLSTDAGILITNAAFVKDAALYDVMGPGRYHGEAYWPWQEALAISGLTEQAKKLDPALADTARAAAAHVEQHAQSAGTYQSKELYAYAIEGGRLVAAAITGAPDEPHDSWPGNDPQLWGAALPLVAWARRKQLI